MKMPDLNELLDFATECALRAGVLLQEGYGSTYEITAKDGRHDLVTEYDLKAEKLILDAVAKRYPDHTCLSEEKGGKLAPPDTIQWVIDPLDGTVNFAHNIPFFAVSIAAVLNGKPLVGVVYNPILDELFFASHEGGAFCNTRQLHVSKVDILSDAMFATGFPYNVQENPDHCIEHLTHILKLGVPIRRMGSAALDLCYVAAGKFDGFWEVVLRPWDYAGAAIILQEAGGKVSDMEGKPLSYARPSPVAASNKLLHPKLIEHLAIL